MSRRRGRFPYFKPKKQILKAPPRFILLDKFTLADIRHAEAIKDAFLKYYWDYHNNLAYQRSKIYDKIKESLIDARQPFPITRWHRALKYRYAIEPFSIAGSLIDPGRRFNIGGINSSIFPPFPALYLASTRDTAIDELLNKKLDPGSQLDPFELSLTRQGSITIVSISGTIGSIINLKEPKNLEKFVDLIKEFKIPDSLRQTAIDIGEREPELIRTVPKLIEVLLDHKWRLSPMQFDVPATSQIFGQMVSEAGIEGILYPSKFSSGDCLAIFPHNLDSNSFLGLDDEAPKETKFTQLNSETWHQIRCLK